MNIIKCNIEEAAVLLERYVSQNQPVFLWGSPGIGKTQLVEQVAAKLGMGHRTFNMGIKTPADLAGIPVPDLDKGEAIWLRPTDLPNVKRDGPTGLFALDEMNTAAPMMQAAGFSLVLERRVGEHHLPAGWVPVGMGNMRSDRAAAQTMPTALRNRFAHIHIVPCIKATTRHFARKGLDPLLIGFLNFREELLHQLPQGEDAAFPSPRSWEAAAPYINDVPAIRLKLIGGLVGHGPASEFESFMLTVSEVPTIQEIVADPARAKVPNGPGAKYAAASLLARSATPGNLFAILAYAARLGREWEALTVVDASKRNPAITSTADFASWAVNNQDITL